MHQRCSPSSRIRLPMLAESSCVSDFGSRFGKGFDRAPHGPGKGFGRTPHGPGKGFDRAPQSDAFLDSRRCKSVYDFFSSAAPNAPLLGSGQEAQIRRPFRRSIGAEASSGCSDRAGQPPEMRNGPIALIKQVKLKEPAAPLASPHR